MNIERKLKTDWQQARRAVILQFSARFRELDAVSACAYGLMTRVNFTVTKTRGLNESVFYFIMALLTKAFKTHQAVCAVSRQGLGEDANGVLRMLYETTVAIDFILRRNSRRRVAVYLAYAAHRQVVVLNQWKNTKGAEA